MLSSAGLMFFLVLCNPISLTGSSTLILNPELTGLNTPFPFLFGFLFGFLGFSSGFGLLIFTIKNMFLTYQNWLNYCFPNYPNDETDPEIMKRAMTFKTYLYQFLDPFNKFLVIACLSIIFQGTGKWSFQLLFQYPIEGVLATSAQASKNLPISLPDLPVSLSNLFIRDFPDLDTGVRNRTQRILATRHFPVDDLLQHRIWEKKPPLTDRQTSDVYYRYNTHPLNQISAFIKSARVQSRTPFSEQPTSIQLERLLELKKIDFNTLPRKVENKAKGAPPMSYVEPKNIYKVTNPYADLPVWKDHLVKTPELDKRGFF